MQYDPKLKTAMQEIKSIMTKHDIGGVVVIHSPGFSEYLLKINPSYSCATIVNGVGIQFKTKSTHYNSIEDRDKVVTDTANLMQHLSDVGGRLSLQVMEASDMLNKHVNATHTNGNHSSHNEQNN